MNRYALFCLSLLFCIAEASSDISFYFDSTPNTSSASTNLDFQLNLASLNTTITHEGAELLDFKKYSYPEKLIAVAVSFAHVPITNHVNIPAMGRMHAS